MVGGRFGDLSKIFLRLSKNGVLSRVHSKSGNARRTVGRTGTSNG